MASRTLDRLWLYNYLYPVKKYTDIILTALKGKKFESILEIGCGRCFNLKAIQEKYPKVKLYGYDNDKNRIEIAQKTKGITAKVGDITGDITKETPFKNKKFDIVFTAAVLIYITPEKIKQVIRNIKKSAKKELILIEIHSSNSKKFKIYFIRNYKKLLKENGFKNIKLKKIPRELWPGLNYKDDGYIISGEL